jgi:hypothetical protein
MSAVLTVHHPPTYAAERAYALDMVLGHWMGLEFEARAQERPDTAISLGDDAPLTLPDGLFATPQADWLTAASVPAELERSDVLGTVFLLLTRYEEVARPERDEHERFPSSATLAARTGRLQSPLVDELVDELWERLRARWPRLERRAASFGLALSHDVDWPYPEARGPAALARAAAGDALRRRDPVLALRRLRGANVNDTFDFLMDCSERRGLRSAFYVMAGRTNPEFDGDYDLNDPWIAGLLRRVDERGHEIGLHPSYETFRDPEALRAEYERLLRACEAAGVAQRPRGGRQHFLRWENPTTWRAWADAGLEYDASLGFSDVMGFRCGTSREFPVFDLRARRALALRERPLVVMEQALARPADVVPAASACRRAGSDLSLLWHNSKLQSRGERAAYEATLDTALSV